MEPYPQRPVDEVVLSLAQEDTPDLGGPRLGLVLGDLLREFPRIETQSPYEMRPELPYEKQALFQGGPRVEILGPGSAMKQRYWFISEDDVELLQVQTDYLAFNWRRRAQDQRYPGFAYIRDRYQGICTYVSESLEALGKPPLRPRQAELTYVNILRPDGAWHSHRQAHELVRLAFPDVDKYEQVSLGYTKPIENKVGAFAGRLYVNLQPAFDLARQAPVINLTFTARSAAFDNAVLDDAADFFELAHSVVTETFQSLVTEQSRRVWGL